MCRSSLKINCSNNRFAFISAVLFALFVIGYFLYYDNYLVSAIMLWSFDGIIILTTFACILCCKTNNDTDDYVEL